MPSRAHEIPVALLSRDPSLLAALAKKLGKPPPAGHRPVDSTGKNGTRVRLEPIVLLIGRDEVDALLDEGRPSLAFFAAWAMQGRRGPEAERVVKRTMELTDRLPARALRQQQRTDIMGVLNGRLAEKLKERVMEAKRSTEPRWVREMREEMFGDQVRALKPKFVAEGEAKGEAKGKREALLMWLQGRGLAISRAQRAAILACEDLAKLDRWIAASGKAATVQELLAEAPKKNGARNGAAKHRTARAG